MARKRGANRGDADSTFTFCCILVAVALVITIVAAAYIGYTLATIDTIAYQW